MSIVLYIGAVDNHREGRSCFHRGSGKPGARRTTMQAQRFCVLFRLPHHDAALMFRLNIETWKDQPYLIESFPERISTRLTDGLDEVRNSPLR